MPIADFVLPADLDDYKAGDPTTLLAQAQSAIRSYCGWHVAPNITETLLLDGRGSSHLWMPSLFVTEVTTVVNEGTTLTSEEYDWSADGYLQRRNGYWSSRPRQVSVTLTHGYEDIPADLVGVAVARAARFASSPAGVKREQAGSVSLERESNGFLADELAILDHYKLPPRP